MPRSEPPRPRRAGARVAALAGSVAFAACATLSPACAAADAAGALSTEGVSHLAASFGRARVDVDLTAHAHALSALAIRVDGYPLAVPPAAWTGLADAASAGVSRRDDGRFLLRLAGGRTGGAGAAPWVVELVFDRLGLRERRLIDAVSGQLRQDLAWGAPELLD